MKTQAHKEMSSAPDGGWGWVVCCACFFAHVIPDGLMYSFGIMYVELLDYFQESKSRTAVIGSLRVGLVFLIGPVNAVLVNRFGCRTVVVFGSLLASISQLVSMFAPSIDFLYVTLGVLTGIGYGSIYLPSIVAVSQYFDKKRAFATGIAVSGSGIGTFILSPVTSSLIEAYTWQGTLLIYSGLLLNCVACGLVFRPIAGGRLEDKSSGCESRHVSEVGFHKENNEVECITFGHTTNNQSSAKETIKGNDLSKLSEEESLLHIGLPNDKTSCIDCSNVETIETQAYLHNSNNSLQKYNSKFADTSINDQMVDKNLVLEKCKCGLRINIEVFKNVSFSMFLALSFIPTIGYWVSFLLLPDTAREYGIDTSQSAWLLSSVGMSSTVTRIIFGFLSDRTTKIKRYVLHCTAIVVQGALIAMIPLFTSFEALLTFSIVYGLFAGVVVSSTSVILTDMVGIDQLADAFGFKNFCEGVAAFVGPVLAGWLFDIFGSYDIAYICCGIATACSSSLMCFIPLCDKFINNRRNSN